ncbi:hypothetical protein BSKO_03502 [Bryopsis sp. KO-2023]|nr:hypothetical protein BSKO_03502 [Bryopsis sp. KO-2023]
MDDYGLRDDPSSSSNHGGSEFLSAVMSEAFHTYSTSFEPSVEAEATRTWRQDSLRSSSAFDQTSYPYTSQPEVPHHCGVCPSFYDFENAYSSESHSCCKSQQETNIWRRCDEQVSLSNAVGKCKHKRTSCQNELHPVVCQDVGRSQGDSCAIEGCLDPWDEFDGHHLLWTSLSGWKKQIHHEKRRRALLGHLLCEANRNGLLRTYLSTWLRWTSLKNALAAFLLERKKRCKASCLRAWLDVVGLRHATNFLAEQSYRRRCEYRKTLAFKGWRQEAFTTNHSDKRLARLNTIRRAFRAWSCLMFELVCRLNEAELYHEGAVTRSAVVNWKRLVQAKCVDQENIAPDSPQSTMHDEEYDEKFALATYADALRCSERKHERCGMLNASPEEASQQAVDATLFCFQNRVVRLFQFWRRWTELQRTAHRIAIKGLTRLGKDCLHAWSKASRVERNVRDFQVISLLRLADDVFYAWLDLSLRKNNRKLPDIGDVENGEPLLETRIYSQASLMISTYGEAREERADDENDFQSLTWAREYHEKRTCLCTFHAWRSVVDVKNHMLYEQHCRKQIVQRELVEMVHFNKEREANSFLGGRIVGGVRPTESQTFVQDRQVLCAKVCEQGCCFDLLDVSQNEKR